MLISIVIPTFNREKIIITTLESVKRQTFQDWECIVVDDGSKDNTCRLLRKYTKEDARFRYIANNHSKGAQGARNTGIENSAGEWIILFDSDNIMHEDFLEKMFHTVSKDVDVCGCWSRVIDCQSKEQVGSFKWVGYNDVYKNLLTGKSYFDNSSTMIRKSKLYEIGLLDELCPSFQEWDTHIRLSKIARYYTVKEYLVDYYSGSIDSISSSLKKEINGYLFILSKYRTEWRKVSSLSYAKYCLVLYKRISSLPDGEQKGELYKQLKKLSTLYGTMFIFLSRIKNIVNF